MRKYPQYDISHYFYKSFREGGLSLFQIIALYDSMTEQEEDDYCFMAAIHGIDLKKAAKKKTTAGSTSNEMFRSKEEYESMTPEEREKETQKMMAELQSKFSGIKGMK